ncbi:MAG: MerR family transcriptional regulator, glutamine synthetase repressor [Thermosediminibacterales bacterium]|nr:MerR family transcriptional regulator, glutamine synthetase repressor [Thermosediminibacterales bacterium]MDK2836120.1 MerR family transcriptional regulator, glutamine synthetase repressor [Thermosediminibacterales bacterium]
MEKKDPAVYSIGIVEERTGLTGRQIRYYEKMGLITPERTEGKQRRYSEKDINLLLKIKQLLSEGLDIKGVKEKLKAIKEELDLKEDLLNSKYSVNIPGRKEISSLYPVSDRAALIELLTEKEKNKKD